MKNSAVSIRQKLFGLTATGSKLMPSKGLLDGLRLSDADKAIRTIVSGMFAEQFRLYHQRGIYPQII